MNNNFMSKNKSIKSVVEFPAGAGRVDRLGCWFGLVGWGRERGPISSWAPSSTWGSDEVDPLRSRLEFSRKQPNPNQGDIKKKI
jgi:hypothetical protein